MEKRRGDAIAGPELEELLRLTEQIERLEAERIEALAKLAQIRGTSLPKLMLELGIQPRPYV
jgi:transposase